MYATIQLSPLQNIHLVAAVWSKDLEQNLIRQGQRHVAHGDTEEHLPWKPSGSIELGEILGLKIEGS
jgi:hypothetical protein